VPATLLLTGLLTTLLGALTPRLLLVRTALLRRLTPTTLRRLPRLTRLLALRRTTGLRTPTTLLRRLPLLRRLAVRRLALRRLTVRTLRLLRAWAPSATLARRLLTPTTLLRLTTLLRRLALLRLTTLLGLTTLWLTALRWLAALLWRLAALSPVLPAWLAPRLPRTPWSLRRRRHICSL
jgi:hypothetical protein